MTGKIRVGVLVSGSGTNLQAIIDASYLKENDWQVAFVGSDKPGVKGLERAAKHHIPNFIVDYEALFAEMAKQWRQESKLPELPPGADINEVFFKCRVFPPRFRYWTLKEGRFWLQKRIAAEEILLRKMAKFEWDLLVLAGFMRNLTPYFIDQVNADPMKPRIMNIHPALLPAFPGTDGYGDTIRYGCKVGGCTVHFIDYGEDSGPIIGQRAILVEPNDDADSFRAKGLQEEYKLYPECIQLFAKGRLRVLTNEVGRKVVRIV